MNSKIVHAVLVSIAAFLYQTPAIADGVSGAGVEIAKCVVSDPANPDFGNSLEVYRLNDKNASIAVVFGKADNKNLVPADNYRFSAGKKSLEIQFAQFVYAQIPRGKNTNGILGVKLGSGPTPLTCDTTW